MDLVKETRIVDTSTDPKQQGIKLSTANPDSKRLTYSIDVYLSELKVLDYVRDALVRTGPIAVSRMCLHIKNVK